MATTFARRLAKTTCFITLFWLGTRVIYPEKFISLYTAERFARWVHGYSSQENFDDLWVLTWVAGSFAFAVMVYRLSIWIFRKMRR